MRLTHLFRRRRTLCSKKQRREPLCRHKTKQPHKRNTRNTNSTNRQYTSTYSKQSTKPTTTTKHNTLRPRRPTPLHPRNTRRYKLYLPSHHLRQRHDFYDRSTPLLQDMRHQLSNLRQQLHATRRTNPLSNHPRRRRQHRN